MTAELGQLGIAALNRVRRTHDTTKLTTAQFEALAKHMLARLDAGDCYWEAAQSAIDAGLAGPQVYGRDHITGNYYRLAAR